MEIQFKDGKAVVKNGRRIIAKVYERAVYFKHSPYRFSHPYSLEIVGVGSRECDTLEEINSYLQKYTA